MIGLGIALLVALAVMAGSGKASAKAPPLPPGMPPVVPGPPDTKKAGVITTGKSGTKWLTQAASAEPSTGYIYVDVFLPDGEMGKHPIYRVLRFAQPPGGAARTLVESSPGVDAKVLAVAMDDFNLTAAVKADVSSMSAGLQKKLQDALDALTVGKDGKIQGPITAASIQFATGVAGELESAGFGTVAASLRGYIKTAASMIPPLSDAKKIPLPASMPADLQAQVNRALQLERDPAKLSAILTALKAYQPQTADITNAIGMLQALILQVQAKQQADIALQKIQPIVTPGEGGAAHYVQYRTRKGDTGSSIAKLFTGDANRWTELLAVNPTTKSAQYGMAFNAGVAVLNIPVSWPPPPGTTAATPPPVAVPGAPPAAPSGVVQYQTKKGDTGSSVAKLFTGNPNRWPELVKANPGTASAQYGMVFNAGVAVLNIPASWPSTPGAAPTALPDQPISVPATPVPGVAPRPKSPAEVAADAMVRNLKAVQGSFGMPKAQGKEDKSIVKRFQGAVNLNADGLAGPSALVAAAVNGQSDLPLVMYWPKASTAANVLKYREDLRTIAARARSAGDDLGASQLEASAAREHGEGKISTGKLVP